MTKPILIIGGASIDTIVQLKELPAPEPQTIWPEASYKTLGSTGAGKALNLAQLERPVVFHTLVGRDDEGQAVRQALDHPLITLLAAETDSPTEQHVNLMSPDGKRISIFTQPSTVPGHTDWGPVRDAMAGCELAVINILAYAQPALDIAKSLHKPIWTDLHDYDGGSPYHQPFIDAADVIFLSSDSLPGYRAVMERLVHQGKQLLICTHGAKGATLLSNEGEWLEQPALPARQVRDTNGAGDAFFSGFLHKYLMGASLGDCLHAGAFCGALCVGARTLAAPELTPRLIE